MGTVHFTQGHHVLYCRSHFQELDRRLLLTPELADMRILSSSRVPIRETTRNMIWAAIRGLQMLNGFNAAISFHCEVMSESGPYLVVPHRTWGEISLEQPDNLVATFSHDSRETNQPFVSLAQWLEEQGPNKAGMSDEGYYEFEREWSNPEKWHQFFVGRIKRRIVNLRDEATSFRFRARNCEMRALAIEELLA